MMGVKTLVGLCVPKMGMHAVTTADAERKEPFQASMIVGYSIGKPIFFEPMISKALLMKKGVLRSHDASRSRLDRRAGIEVPR